MQILYSTRLSNFFFPSENHRSLQIVFQTKLYFGTDLNFMSLVSKKEILVHCIYTNETDQYKYLIKTKDVIMVTISTEGIT